MRSRNSLFLNRNPKVQSKEFVLLSLVTASACHKTEDMTGAVIKGPLKNATVFLDYDNDGLRGSSEPFAVTGDDGSFSINGIAGTGFTVVTDDTTVDTSSGEVLSNVILKAPSGSAVVSPVTTIMQEAGLSSNEVGAILGLPEGVDATQFNPFSSDSDTTTALAVEKVAHQVMTTVTALQSAIEGAGVETEDAFSIALGSLVEKVVEKGNSNEIDTNSSAAVIDFTDPTEIMEIASIAEKAVLNDEAADFTKFEDIVEDVKVAVVNVNTAIGSAKDLTSEESEALFGLANELSTQIKSAAESSDFTEESITFSDNEAVLDKVEEKIIEKGGTIEPTTKMRGLVPVPAG